MDAAEPLWESALARQTARIRATVAARPDGFPHYADPATGRWTTTADGFWTGGFWAGMLWLAAHYEGDERLRAEAAQWTGRLEGKLATRSIFRAFLFWYAAVLGATVAGDGRARDLALRAARAIADGFDERAGLIPLGVEAEEAHTVGNDESNIDGLVATPLLLWAARETGDGAMRRIALAHARRNAEFCVRADGSVIQSASFDRATGTVIRRYTHKGHADDSVWTRAQAWPMLFYALAARLAPEEPDLLALADTVTQWWLAHVPADRVAWWDFGAPDTRRDTSGTAIAAAAMLKLAAIHPDRARAAEYRDAAAATVRALVDRHLTPDGILADGCFDPNNGTAVAHELVWGSYFLYESLGVLSGRLQAGVA